MPGSENTPEAEVKVPFMGGTLTFQDPFDFEGEDGQKKHVNARVVITGTTNFAIKLELNPGLLALVKALKLSEVQEWMKRNAQQ